VKAIVYDQYGPADNLDLRDVADPECGPQDLLIEVHAAAINPVDWKIRAGYQRAINPQRFPARTGMDVSGVVLEVGSAVSGFSVGDAVFSSPSHKRLGTLAERIAVRADECALKPPRLTHIEAASFPLVGLTAWDCLSWAQVEAGERLMVEAAAGGVGSIATQLGVAMGAEVAGTCSPKNTEFVASLGAIPIDYRSQRWSEVLPPQDVVLDSLGPVSASAALAAVALGGRVASINAGVVPATTKYGPWLGTLAVAGGLVRLSVGARMAGKRFKSVLRQASGANLAVLAEHLEAGRVVAQVGRVLPLAEAAEAHRLGEAGAVRGKIVLQVRED